MLRVVPFVAALTACEQADETVTAYAPHDGVYALVSLNGADFAAKATIDLRTAGNISGQAPCNSYNASQSAPYPWITLGPIAATRRACPDLADESRYLEALAAMTQVEASGDTLILSNDDGTELVFQASP